MVHNNEIQRSLQQNAAYVSANYNADNAESSSNQSMDCNQRDHLQKIDYNSDKLNKPNRVKKKFSKIYRKAQYALTSCFKPKNIQPNTDCKTNTQQNIRRYVNDTVSCKVNSSTITNIQQSQANSSENQVQKGSVLSSEVIKDVGEKATDIFQSKKADIIPIKVDLRRKPQRESLIDYTKLSPVELDPVQSINNIKKLISAKQRENYFIALSQLGFSDYTIQKAADYLCILGVDASKGSQEEAKMFTANPDVSKAETFKNDYYKLFDIDEMLLKRIGYREYIQTKIKNPQQMRKDIVELTQHHLLRNGKKAVIEKNISSAMERQQLSDNPKHTAYRSYFINNASIIGMIDDKLPQRDQYDATLIYGASEQGFLNRLHFFEQHVHTSLDKQSGEIYALGGARPLWHYVAYQMSNNSNIQDGEKSITGLLNQQLQAKNGSSESFELQITSVFQKYLTAEVVERNDSKSISEARKKIMNDPLFKDITWPTESDMMRYYIQERNLSNVVSVISAPMSGEKRPTTKDTLNETVKYLENEFGVQIENLNILAVSSQPHTLYQDAVIHSVDYFANQCIETVGAGVNKSTVKITEMLDAFARTIYQRNRTEILSSD